MLLHDLRFHPPIEFIVIPDRVQILENRSLRLDNVSMEDAGEYSCEAENAVGAVIATGTLTVVGELISKNNI